jgi:hypothetical protein
MKSRRRIAFSKAQHCANYCFDDRLQQEFAIREMGSVVILRSSNPEERMSESGQFPLLPHHNIVVRSTSVSGPSSGGADRSLECQEET